MDKTIAFFDFDGTITRKDTLLEFMKFALGTRKAIFLYIKLLPSAVAFALKRISNQEFKEKFLTLAFRGVHVDILREKAGTFALERLPFLMRTKALDRIAWHREQGHRVIVVSASAKLWLQHWCRDNEIELICSQLEENEGIITGRLKGKNCRGPEKVVQIKKHVKTEEYQTIYAYGDSSGDIEMLDFADKPHFKPFRD